MNFRQNKIKEDLTEKNAFFNRRQAVCDVQLSRPSPTIHLRSAYAVRSAVSRTNDSPMENWKLDFNSKQISSLDHQMSICPSRVPSLWFDNSLTIRIIEFSWWANLKAAGSCQSPDRDLGGRRMGKKFKYFLYFKVNSLWALLKMIICFRAKRAIDL
jgi:hypothetical protein